MSSVSWNILDFRLRGRFPRPLAGEGKGEG